MPKSNKYQSLHTTVIGPYGERIEIQIRTHEMHEVAERGIAAHWQYKEGRVSKSDKDNVAWVSRLYEWQKDLADPNEFLETVKIDLFAEDVFIFTPKGEVKQLSFGATPLDFAFAVHSEVGTKTIGAKVNGKIVPLKHKLKSGDTVEILTSPNQTPTKDWLKIVKSSKAKAKIRAFIKQQERIRAQELGREILEKALRPYKGNLNRLEKSDKIQAVAHHFNYRGAEELFIALGYGRMTSDDVIKEIIPKDEIERFKAGIDKGENNDTFLKKVFRAARNRSSSKNAISVANLSDVLIRFGKCCNPLPGDPIIGFITRGRGVTVHTSNCSKALDQDADRKVDVRWNIHNKGATRHHVTLRVLSLDEPGLLAIMTQTIASCGVNISSADIRTTKDKKAVCKFEVEVTDVEQLHKVTGALESKSGVITVERYRS